MATKKRTAQFKKGQVIGINDDCLGTVTKVTSTRVYIESKVFTGWALKSDIIEAMRYGRD